MKVKTLHALSGLAIAALLLIAGCTSLNQTKSIWADGSYKGSGEGIHGTIELTVVISDGSISEITIDQQHETEGVSELALEEIPAAIIDAQSVEVDTVAGASVTSGAVIDAVSQALAEAEKVKKEEQEIK